MKTTKLIAILLLLFASNSLCDITQSAGTAIYPFLKIGYTARGQAISGSLTGLADDVCTNEFNPAGIANIKGSQYLFSQASLFQGISADNFSFATRFGDNALGINGRILRASDVTRSLVDITSDEQELREGTEIRLADYAFSLLYAHSFMVGENVVDEFKLGFGITGVSEKLINTQSSAVMADIGILYKPYNTNNGLGLVLQNFGTTVSGNSLPTTIRGGFGYQGKSNNFSFDIVQAIDTKTKFNFGIELLFEKFLVLRGGGSYSQDFSYSAGFGVNFGVVKIDYAFVPHSDLGQTNYLTLILGFGGEKY